MSSPISTRTRGDIQGLRAVAVGTVVLSHAAVPGFAGGYVGVDVFFVISGFLITGILVREVDRRGHVSIVDFYARRARRILPAASVTLMAITLASWLAFGYVRVSQVLDDVVWASLFGANIHFALQDSDYFAQDTFVSPVQHFWSLAVEEQFYLGWPLLIAAVAWLGTRDRLHTTPRRTVAIALAAVCGVSLLWSVHATGTSPTTAYFSTFARIWELGAGALLALAATRIATLRRTWLDGAGLLGLLLIAMATVGFSERTPFPGSAALLPVIGSVLVLAGGLAGDSESPRRQGAAVLLDRAPMRWLGDISYSLYLWHWPFLVIPAMAVGHDLGLGWNALLVLGAVVASALTYRYVETPFRTGRAWQHSQRRALALWPVAVGAVLVSTLAVQLQLPPTGASAVRLDPQQARNVADVPLAVKHAAARARAGAALPEGLTPAPLELEHDNWHMEGRCWSRHGEPRHEVCTFGDTSAERTIALFGDSQIGVWHAPITRLAERHGWKVLLFLKTGCPPYDVTVWSDPDERPDLECNEWREWALEELAKIEPERIVITGFTVLPLVSTRSARQRITDADLPELESGMRSAMERLVAITPRVTLIGDTNQLPRPSADCLGERDVDLGTCARPQNPHTVARNELWSRVVREAGGRYVDPRPWICAEGTCPLVVGNVIVYTDRHHLTATYARLLEPDLDRILFGR